jgi:uncharacterized protein involved in exopolysaccharide biosynthesis
MFFQPSYAKTAYYKCITAKSTTFSQFPCSKNATAYKITTNQSRLSGPQKNVLKKLNGLEKKRIIKDLTNELRSNEFKLVLLNREIDKAEFKQQQRLKHILNKTEIKKVTRDINKQLKKIKKDYEKQVKSIEKRIEKLEKKIATYQ